MGTPSRTVGGGWIYVWTALLDQRPRDLIKDSGRPTAEAVVAAPIRKLCEEYVEWLRPAREANCLIARVRVWREKGEPEVRTKETELSDGSGRPTLKERV